MKMLLLFLAAVFCGTTAGAQDLKIAFRGSGASTTVTTVRIENLTRGTFLTLKGQDTLQLTMVTGVAPAIDNSSALNIYPNPTIENSFLEFTPRVPGRTVIKIYDLTGKSVAAYSEYLANTRQKFIISCIDNGTYLVTVSGRNYHFSGRLISIGNLPGAPSISKVNELSPSRDILKAVPRNIEDDTTILAYAAGEKLKFTGISGNYSTVVVDSPGNNKTIEFQFLPCTDGDNNNYPSVKIGEQIWMAENLKTTKYRDGSPVPYNNRTIIGAIESGYPAYSWYNNDPAYKDIYGGLYTVETLRTRKLCPVGWHAMDHSEMDMLVSYLGGGSNYQAGYGGKSDDGGKLKETGTAHWKSPNAYATNESGFTALPGGIREEEGTFRGIGEKAMFMSFNVCDGPASDGCMYQLSYDGREILGDEYAGTSSTSVRCIYGGGPQILSTWIDSASVDLTSATAGGEIDILESVTERGLCWSTYYYPTVSDNHVTAGTGAGRFSSKITGLNPGSLYWVRAYAKNETGTTYGNSVSFTTSIRDIEGNVYKTVAINQVFEGRQIWMASNLRTTTFNDRTKIAELSAPAVWSSATTPAFCSYDNQKNEKYGLLYNWYTVETGKLCPDGWKIADTTEYKVNVGPGHNLDLKVLIQGGMRDSTGGFKEKDQTGYFWFSTGDVNGQQAWSWSFKNETSKTSVSSYNKKSGFSVRCFKKVIP